MKQNENLSVSGALWAMLATMEKQGVDVLESPFLPTTPQVLELATNCQGLLASWLNRLVFIPVYPVGHYSDCAGLKVRELCGRVGQLRAWSL